MAPDAAPQARIRRAAQDLGFDACRFADVRAPWPSGPRLRDFIALDRHGEMGWMETTLERRAHPRALWPDANSAIVLGLSYAPGHDPLEELEQGGRGYISVYARGDDYHEVIKPRLKRLAAAVAAAVPGDLKVFVDTAALMEKPLAQRAGLGWQGKHTNLVSREFGSWLLLGVILTQAELPPDEAEVDHCGTCRACLDVCPTNAFPAPYRLDARRCLSYLTIEHAGAWPEPLRIALGNRIYGCDDCLAVCPWNAHAAAAREIRLASRPENVGPELGRLSELDDAAFRARFAKSPVKRIGRERFVRNVLYAMANAADPALVHAVKARLDDVSPLVRAAAAWAYRRLAPPHAVERARAWADQAETDIQARAEWGLGPSGNAPEPGSGALSP